MTKDSLIEKLEAVISSGIGLAADMRDEWFNKGIQSAIVIARQHQAEQSQEVIEKIFTDGFRMGYNFRQEEIECSDNKKPMNQNEIDSIADFFYDDGDRYNTVIKQVSTTSELQGVAELLRDMRVQVQWSDKAAMPIPLYERMKAAITAMGESKPDNHDPRGRMIAVDSPAKTSWTCPDCCVNPCDCTIMGDASVSTVLQEADHNQSSPANSKNPSLPVQNFQQNDIKSSGYPVPVEVYEYIRAMANNEQIPSGSLVRAKGLLEKIKPIKCLDL